MMQSNHESFFPRQVLPLYITCCYTLPPVGDIPTLGRREAVFSSLHRATADQVWLRISYRRFFLVPLEVLIWKNMSFLYNRSCFMCLNRKTCNEHKTNDNGEQGENRYIINPFIL